MDIYTSINHLYSYLDYAIISIPCLFILSKFKTNEELTNTSLQILRWLFIFGALFQLMFYINEVVQFFWFGAYDQIAYIPKQIAFYNRAFGEYWYFYWIMLFGKMIFPLFLVFTHFGRNYFWVFIMAFFFKFGMYMERFVILVTSFHKDFLTSSWTYYSIEPFLWLLKGLILT
ncbi:MAG: hypothetical protein ACK43K_00065, partial [Chitinophagales bacterium]